MGRRPTPNPRRGIVRAAITVIVLTVLLVIAILVVSSLTAPSAKAPTNPPTPGPITPVVAPTATPRVVPSPTHKKTLGSVFQNQPSVNALDTSPSISMLKRAASWHPAGIAVRSHALLAWFAATRRGMPTGSLRMRTLPHGSTVKIGLADSLVKPVWSGDGRFLLYVASTQSHRSPGVQWDLMQYDAQKRVSTRLASLPGLSMVPLGWWRMHPLFLVATGSDTSFYTARAGHARFLEVLAPQVITSAGLSPGTSVVAFAAPSNCYNCTLDFFDLRTLSEWSGPSGLTNESQVAWSRDARSVVTMIHGRIAVVAASSGGHIQLGGPVGLPKSWLHSLAVSVGPRGVRLLDTVTGQTIFSAFRVGTL